MFAIFEPRALPMAIFDALLMVDNIVINISGLDVDNPINIKLDIK
jgi:hypothetical protein